jgi:hypothetical protein
LARKLCENGAFGFFDQTTAELETGWILKPTLRTKVLERIAALTTELHPVGVVKAAV